jgi:hypothetical protein
MEMATRTSAMALGLGWLAGVIVCVVLYGARWTVLPYFTSNLALFTVEIVAALLAVVPGLVAGYWAGRHGAIVGAATGLLGSLTASATVSGMALTELTAMFMATEMGKAVAAAGTNGISGVVGERLRSLPSNTTPHPDANLPPN